MEPQLTFFYYNRRKIGALLFFYVLLLIVAIAVGMAFYPQYYAATALAVFLCITAISAAAFVFFFPQNLAVVSDRAIKIDHGFPLPWKEMCCAEEIMTNKTWGRRIIVFKMKEGFSCPFTLMQHLCKNSCFTPFSIPLYAMSEKDQAEIKKMIADHTTLIDKTKPETNQC